MASIPSPILIFGDKYLSRNNIIVTKKKHPDLNWVTLSATSSSLNEIRAEVGTGSWDSQEKVVVIEDIPNRKEVREFLLDIAKNTTEETGIIVVDTKNHIKIDPKTQTFGKTWAPFVRAFKKIDGSTVINNGDPYNDKSRESCVSFVEKAFLKNGVQIKSSEVELVLSIVGYDRGLLLSDIEKMSLTASSPITSEFIIENAFPGSKEAIMYKFSNALDSGLYTEAINSVDEFIDVHGINENVLADMLMKKARWQLAAAYYYYKGASWAEVTEKIMNMGKFPSYVWHHPKLDFQKKSEIADQYKDNRAKFLITKQGMPYYCFQELVEASKKTIKKTKKTNKPTKATSKKGRAEVIPMKFMASQISSFVRDKIVNPRLSDENIKIKTYKRALKVYLFAFEKLVEIRKGKNPRQSLKDGIRMFVNLNPDNFLKD